MDKRREQLEPIWERFIGWLTPKEFIDGVEVHERNEPGRDDLHWAVDQYVQSMAEEFPDIVNHKNELLEYMNLYYIEMEEFDNLYCDERGDE